MRVLLQRVSQARVEVEGERVGSIGKGLLALVGLGEGDSSEDLGWMVRKIAGLRVFEDQDGRFQHDVRDVEGAVLAVSQFTLYGRCDRGRRPSFTEAMAPAEAEALFDQFVNALRAEGLTVETGVFGAHMAVHLINDGPVTLWLDSRSRPSTAD